MRKRNGERVALYAASIHWDGVCVVWAPFDLGRRVRIGSHDIDGVCWEA
jgi:hypothetical protein